MKIYIQELLDGIAEKIRTEASIKSHLLLQTVRSSQANRNVMSPDNREMRPKMDDIESEDVEEPSELEIEEPLGLDPDLYPLKTVLVSSGWNKNDDVFAVEELYKSKNTPIHKKIDFQHDELIIIGHISESYLVDKSGNVLNVPMEEMPEECDIITEGFLYTLWQDPERTHLINSIIAGIPEDKWFVSMECFFDNFDYAIKKDGKTWVLQRNEETAFLTKHLRAYGGTGEYEGYRVGRLIKDLIFSGKGIVENPANPDSVFLEVESFSTKNELSNFNFQESSVYIHKEEPDMDLEKKLAEAEKTIAEQKSAIDELTAKLAKENASASEIEKKTLEVKLETAKAEIETYQNKFTVTEQALENLKNELAEAKKEIEAAQKEKEEMAKKAKSAIRASKLVEAGLSEDEAKTQAEKWIDISEEYFDDYVIAVKGKKTSCETPAKAEDNSVVEDVVEETEVEVEPVIAEEISPDKELMVSVAKYFESSIKQNKKTKGEK